MSPSPKNMDSSTDSSPLWTRVTPSLVHAVIKYVLKTSDYSNWQALSINQSLIPLHIGQV